VATELDERLRADRILARLPGRFLFVLDDGRGDRVGRSTAASTSPRTVG
jgi:precorrin-3B synthase